LDLTLSKWNALNMSFMNKRFSKMQGSGQSRGRDSGFFDVAPARRLDACNTRRECLERPCFQCKGTTIEIKSFRHISDKRLKVILWIK